MIHHKCPHCDGSDVATLDDLPRKCRAHHDADGVIGMVSRPSPAAIAAEAIVADLAARHALVRAGVFGDRADLIAAWTGIIAQATLDACEQAEPRVRRETLFRVAADARAMAEGQPTHAADTLEELAARLEAEAAGVAREPNRCT